MIKQLIILLFLLLPIAALSQKKLAESDINKMKAIVEDGLKNKPASFFNKGNTYDYESNIKVLYFSIPEDQEFPGFNRDATAFFSIVTYQMEEKEFVQKYKIICRKNGEDMKFYSANPW